MEELEKLKKNLGRLNGSNLIVEDNQGSILVGRAKYGRKQFMLPGGAIERGERPVHAAVSETEEETKIVVQENDCKFLGTFLQKIAGVESVTGFLFLYATTIFSGELPENGETKELKEIQFMPIEEIIKRHLDGDFSLAYVRMIAYHELIKEGLFGSCFEKRLSEPVLYLYKGELISI